MSQKTIDVEIERKSEANTAMLVTKKGRGVLFCFLKIQIKRSTKLKFREGSEKRGGQERHP